MINKILQILKYDITKSWILESKLDDFIASKNLGKYSNDPLFKFTVIRYFQSENKKDFLPENISRQLVLDEKNSRPSIAQIKSMSQSFQSEFTTDAYFFELILNDYFAFEERSFNQFIKLCDFYASSFDSTSIKEFNDKLFLFYNKESNFIMSQNRVEMAMLNNNNNLKKIKNFLDS